MLVLEVDDISEVVEVRVVVKDELVPVSDEVVDIVLEVMP